MVGPAFCIFKIFLYILQTIRHLNADFKKEPTISISNFREIMLAVIRGELPDGIVVVPRLDIWYNRNKARGTLPAGYETLSLRETAGRLGVGFHSVIPDFIRNAPVEAIYHRGLGFYNNPDFPYTVDFSEIDFEVSVSENELKVTYHTSEGEITTRCEYGPEFFESGSSIPQIKEHAVKGDKDYSRWTYHCIDDPYFLCNQCNQEAS
jgi:hypothetical protein